MSFWGRFHSCWLAALTLIAVNGCLPSDSSSLDDEKEPHYVLGKNCVNALDYTGAIKAFTEALEVNPRSAAAHFQLACLFDTSPLSDPAAAIYHYQEYLRLNPKADNAEVITNRIKSCKVQLAANVVALPSVSATQQQLEDLIGKNRRLQDEVDKWRAYYNAQQAALKAGPATAQNTAAQNNFVSPAAGSPPPDDGATVAANNSAATTPASTRARPQPAPAAKPRTHTVRAGETLASIARNAGVSLAAIQAANPGINPRKMSVGQTVKLP
jgi:LysM repeat protein